MKKLIKVSLLTLLCLGLVGCGVKGPLYQPQSTPSTTSNSTQ